MAGASLGHPGSRRRSCAGTGKKWAFCTDGASLTLEWTTRADAVEASMPSPQHASARLRRCPAGRAPAGARSAGGCSRPLFWALVVALASASCGNAPPNDLLIPPPASTGDSDGSGTMPSSGGNDETVPEAGAVVVPDATVSTVPDSSNGADSGMCGPETCDGGCCDPTTGMCVDGTDESACGGGGAACMSCGIGVPCTAGVCGMPEASDEGGCDPTSCPKCTLRMACCTAQGACGCALGLLCF
jgi:hypothetical protein